MPLSMDNRNRMVCLFDCYGSLLTEKQRTLFAYYFDEDLSLAEISDLVGISRQAVHNSEVDAVRDRTIGAIEAGLSTGQWPEETFTEILAQLKKTR